MKRKQIIVLIIAVAVVVGCCAISVMAHKPAAAAKPVEELVLIESIIPLSEAPNTHFAIDRIEVFVDQDLYYYSLEELKTLIELEKADQENAHMLAEAARSLGWPEDSAPIQSAKAEWWNAQAALDLYEPRYEELYAESMAKWDAKKIEYPYATEIWLYMKEQGWNDYVCAGIMGNLMAEVGGQTLNIQYWLYGDGFYGMCQWSRGYKEIWGAELTAQCEFLAKSIKPEFDVFGSNYAKGFDFNSFLELTNERDAALAFAKCYERCNSAYYSVRQDNAEKAYDYFVNN